MKHEHKLGLYIHWPFCLSKCPYCDFNSHVWQHVDHKAFEDAYLHELRRYAAYTPHHVLHTIFFGGGTPSLMPPALTAKLIATARALWPSADPVEITLEANPATIDQEKFNGFREAGVNRLSIGVQSFDDKALQFLGRQHGASEASKAITLATQIFPRVSFDLIYARPQQTLSEWRQELKHALSYQTEHLSLYQLTIEPHTQFATRHARGDFEMPCDDKAADFYEMTEEILAAQGIYPYEVSNYAKPGAESQHNLIYWRYQDYIGIGPGAHGRFMHDAQKIATEQIKAPELWLKQIQTQNQGDKKWEKISASEQIKEKIMMGLRLKEGIHIPDLEAHVHTHRLQHLIKENYISYNDYVLKSTKKGFTLLNAIYQVLCVQEN